jgi:hypothetical protein
LECDFRRGNCDKGSVTMPGDPSECREHAKRCLKVAASTRSPLAKAQFEELAQKWLVLATDLERAKAS